LGLGDTTGEDNSAASICYPWLAPLIGPGLGCDSQQDATLSPFRSRTSPLTQSPDAPIVMVGTHTFLSPPPPQAPSLLSSDPPEAANVGLAEHNHDHLAVCSSIDQLLGPLTPGGEVAEVHEHVHTRSFQGWLEHRRSKALGALILARVADEHLRDQRLSADGCQVACTVLCAAAAAAAEVEQHQ